MSKTLIDEEVAMQMYRAGNVDRAIAERLGCGETAVFNWRKRNMLPSMTQQKRYAKRMSNLDKLAIAAKNAHTTYGQYVARTAAQNGL